MFQTPETGFSQVRQYRRDESVEVQDYKYQKYTLSICSHKPTDLSIAL